MDKTGLGGLFLILVFITAIPTVAQNAPSYFERGLPEGWVYAPSSKDNPDLWECAGRGGSWVVSEHQDAVVIKELNLDAEKQVLLPRQLRLSKEMIGWRSVLRTSDGWLIGFDAGEFGGGLWWFSRDGRNTMKLLPENVHAIYETPDGIFVLVGLAHLSEDSGEIVQFIDGPEKVSFRRVASLGGSPEASALDPDGQIVIATMHSVLRVDHSGKVHELYKSGEHLTYPTSLVVGGNGNIFVAMRFFVLRLVSDNGAYQPQWLMPKKCRSFKSVKYICTCTAPD
jgi:hypothetical protein